MLVRHQVIGTWADKSNSLCYVWKHLVYKSYLRGPKELDDNWLPTDVLPCLAGTNGQTALLTHPTFDSGGKDEINVVSVMTQSARAV